MDLNGEQVIFRSRPYLQVRLMLGINKTKLKNYIVKGRENIKNGHLSSHHLEKKISGYSMEYIDF